MSDLEKVQEMDMIPRIAIKHSSCIDVYGMSLKDIIKTLSAFDSDLAVAGATDIHIDVEYGEIIVNWVTPETDEELQRRISAKKAERLKKYKKLKAEVDKLRKEFGEDDI